MGVKIFLIIFKKRAFKQGLTAILLLVISGYAATQFSPTLRNKVLNTRQDLNIYKTNGYANSSSLSTRFISYENAIMLFNENKLIGCGLGDLEIKNNILFSLYHPEIEIPIIPHNQFLYYLAAMGILGLLAFTLSFFFPLFYRKNYRNEFLLMHYIVLFLSFQTEPMLETQLGVACSLVFIIFPLMLKQPEGAG
jgi:O-antigen ligase